MTDGVTFNGLWSLAGDSVAVVVAGLDCGNYTIGPAGTIFVPFGSDPDGLFTAGYLNSVSDNASPHPALTSFVVTNTATGETITVYVPVVIGYPFVSKGQLLRPQTEQQLRTPQGGGVGKTRRVHWYGALLKGAQGVSFGTDLTGTLDAAPLIDGGGNILTKDTLFSGVLAAPLDDRPSFDGRIAWEISRPYPCTVVGLTSFLEVSER